MKLTKCANKHFFDADQFSRCPHCDKAGLAPLPAFQVGPMRHVRTEEPGAKPPASLSPLAKSNIAPSGQIQAEDPKTEKIMDGFVVGAYNQPAAPPPSTPVVSPEIQSPQAPANPPGSQPGVEAAAKTLFCGHCGAAFHGTGAFCIMCGAKVTKASEKSEPIAVAPLADAVETPQSLSAPEIIPDTSEVQQGTQEAQTSAGTPESESNVPEIQSETEEEQPRADEVTPSDEATSAVVPAPSVEAANPVVEAVPQSVLAKAPAPQVSLQSQINAVSSHNQAEDVKTMAFYNFSDVEPVVGWLVCVKGEYIGQSFNLKAGQNFVGRSLTMDIPLAKDTSVSRNKHTIITFDPQSRGFFIQPGESNGLTYLNGEVVLVYQPINPYGRIRLGNSELLFVPFCGEQFSWEESV